MCWSLSHSNVCDGQTKCMNHRFSSRGPGRWCVFEHYAVLGWLGWLSIERSRICQVHVAQLYAAHLGRMWEETPSGHKGRSPTQTGYHGLTVGESLSHSNT